MSELISIRRGRYNITPHVWFDVIPTDDGVRLSLCDIRANRKYTVNIEDGSTLSWREVDKLDRDAPDPQPTPGKPLPKLRTGAAPSYYGRHKPAMEPSPLKGFKASRVRFIVQYRDDSRYRNHCFTLGGYTDGSTTYVFYRIKNSAFCLGRLLANKQIILKDETDPTRLPYDDWAAILNMPAGSQFKLGDQIWRKVDPDDLEPLVHGQVFRELKVPIG